MEQIKSLIAAGKTDEAIKLLLEIATTRGKKFRQQAHLISSQYNRLKQEKILGIAEDEERKLSRIEYNIVSLVDQSEPVALSASKGNKSLWIALGAVLVLGFGAYGLSQLFSGNPAATQATGETVTPPPSDTLKVGNRPADDLAQTGKTSTTVDTPDPVVAEPAPIAHFTERERWLRVTQSSAGWDINKTDFQVADTNGDGLDDLIIIEDDGISVALGSKFGSFSQPKRWTSEQKRPNQAAQAGITGKDVLEFGDVNGDKQADLISFNQQGVSVGISTGTGFKALVRWTDEFSLTKSWYTGNYAPHFEKTAADLNADGKVDVVGFSLRAILGCLSTGTAFTPSTEMLKDSYVVGFGGYEAKHQRQLADVNGDNYADIVAFGGKTYVALNDQQGHFLGSPQELAAFGDPQWNKKDHFRDLGDINGDGKADIIGFNQAGIQVALSTGDKAYDKVETWWSPTAQDKYWSTNRRVRRIGDFNGDGKVDILAVVGEEVYVSLTN